MEGNFGIATTDPLCDEMYAVCDNCPTRSSCDYFASGQVSQCTSTPNVVMENRPEGHEFQTDDRIEERFDQMIRDNRLRVICDQTPRRAGYSDARHCGRRRC